MTIRVGLSGFGRIGRLTLRALYESKANDIDIVAVNDWSNLETAARLFKYDSIHGRFNGQVAVGAEGIDLGRGTIRALSSRDPKQLAWGDHGVDVVLECTGAFNERDKAAGHLDAGAKRVVVSAPCKNADATVVYGVNDNIVSAEHLVVSSASCTTNCLAPVASVLHNTFGIEEGFCTTVHAYTGDQNLIDSRHKDPRRSRAAAMSMIPTSTGAAKAVGEVLPELKGKLNGAAVRVPTANVSMIDFTARISKSASVEAINAALKEASVGRLSGVLAYNDEPLVSCDFNGDPHSSIFDATETKILGDRFIRVVSWYDNEWGFANRMLDMTRAVAGTL